MKKTNLVTKIIIDSVLGLIILGSLAFGIERFLSITPHESTLGRLYSGLNWDVHEILEACIRKGIAEDAVSESGIKIDSRVRISPNDGTVGYSESNTVVVESNTDDVFDVTVQYIDTSTEWQRDVAIILHKPGFADRIWRILNIMMIECGILVIVAVIMVINVIVDGIKILPGISQRVLCQQIAIKYEEAREAEEDEETEN